MGYIDDITALQEISFDDIRRIAYNDISTLSDKERTEIYDSLNHGVDLLNTDIQMFLKEKNILYKHLLDFLH